MFKIGKVYQTRAMCFCPYHVSEKGTADLDVTLEGQWAGYWHCWGCQKSGKITREELEELRKMRGQSSKKIVQKDWPQLNQVYKADRRRVGVKAPLDFSHLTFMLLEWGWDQENICHTFPMKNENNEIVGIHRRWPDGNKGMIGKLGLFIPTLNWKHDKPLYITEGVSDLAVILECGLQGIGRPNASSCKDEIEDWMYIQDMRSFTKIIADNDETGIKGAKILANWLDYDDVYFKVPNPYKDLREIYETIGKQETKKWLEG